MPGLNFVVRVAFCFLFIFVPLGTLDQWLYDHFFRLRGTRRQPSPILLIRVNDSRLHQYFQTPGRITPREQFPLEPKIHSLWYQDFYEPLVKRIEADSPKLILFASYFEWIDRKKSPQLPYNNVLYSSLVNDENKVIPPLPSFIHHDNYGFSNLFPDTDNVVRKHYLVYSSGSSLALTTYDRLKTDPIKRNLLDPMWIDFRGAANSYPSFDALDLFENGFSPGTFKDRIVIFGREGGPFTDLDTPFGSMSPLELHANVVDTFLDRREVKILPRRTSLITAGIAVGISVAIITLFPMSLAWLFLLLFSMFTVLSALFLFSTLKIWVGIANPLFAIFGTHLLMLGYKLGKQEEQQWKIQQESEYLKELDEFKNNFISLFSHDLKTPIAKIKAVTDSVLSGHHELPEEVRESLKSIDRTNGELSRFISDILKVTKMESMRVEPKQEVVDLNRLAENSVSRLRFMADEKKIRLVLDLEPLFSMEGDSQLLQEVVTNLVENAIKYSGEKTTVTIRTREEEGRVRVSVIDQGVGIPEDEIPRVTGKFYRGKRTLDQVKGSGLGLYLSKYFVELHKGVLEIKSRLGHGSEVSFTLPLPS